MPQVTIREGAAHRCESWNSRTGRPNISAISCPSPEESSTIVGEPVCEGLHDLCRLSSIGAKLVVPTGAEAEDNLARIATKHVLCEGSEVRVGGVWVGRHADEAIVVLRQHIVHTGGDGLQ